MAWCDVRACKHLGLNHLDTICTYAHEVRLSMPWCTSRSQMTICRREASNSCRATLHATAMSLKIQKPSPRSKKAWWVPPARCPENCLCWLPVDEKLSAQICNYCNRSSEIAPKTLLIAATVPPTLLRDRWTCSILCWRENYNSKKNKRCKIGNKLSIVHT